MQVVKILTHTTRTGYTMGDIATVYSAQEIHDMPEHQQNARYLEDITKISGVVGFVLHTQVRAFMVVFADEVAIMKTQEELGEEVCDYCPLPEQSKGVHNYGSGPVMCFDSGCCEEAYENYLEEAEEDE